MGARSKSLNRPDEATSFAHGHSVEVHLGELTVGRNVHEPGFRWSKHIRPIVGTPTCQFRHIGVVLSGRGHAVFDDGNLRGLAVHTAARIMALASPGEVLVSGSTRDLVDAPDLQFVDRGTHELRGVTRARQLYALEDLSSA